jgi:hypothetical protein
VYDIERGQTTQWPKEKEVQQSTKHYTENLKIEQHD